MSACSCSLTVSTACLRGVTSHFDCLGARHFLFCHCLAARQTQALTLTSLDRLLNLFTSTRSLTQWASFLEEELGLPQVFPLVSHSLDFPEWVVVLLSADSFLLELLLMHLRMPYSGACPHSPWHVLQPFQMIV